MSKRKVRALNKLQNLLLSFLLSLCPFLSCVSPIMSQENQNPYDPFLFDPFFHNPSVQAHPNISYTSFDVSSSDHHFWNNGVPEPAGNNGAGCKTFFPVQLSSVSSSSNEVVLEEDSGKSLLDDVCDDKSNKMNDKQKKKKEAKALKGPRFAFVTRTEIEQLEDGYRWRKYGQKAVKNSPYPRSYYRCTTQKCTVKKRVERSFQDPATVITTYEGQHNHLNPAALRRNAAAMFSANAASFDFPPYILPTLYNTLNPNPTLHCNVTAKTLAEIPTHISLVPEFGLLQDLVDHSSLQKTEEDPDR